MCYSLYIMLPKDLARVPRQNAMFSGRKLVQKNLGQLNQRLQPNLGHLEHTYTLCTCRGVNMGWCSTPKCFSERPLSGQFTICQEYFMVSEQLYFGTPDSETLGMHLLVGSATHIYICLELVTQLLVPEQRPCCSSSSLLLIE